MTRDAIMRQRDRVEKKIKTTESLLKKLQRQFESLRRRAARVPKVGEDVYIDSAFHIDRGEDDRVGGLARVTSVKTTINVGKTVHVIGVKEVSDQFYWENGIGLNQEELRKEFGHKRAYPDPDRSR